MNAKSNCMQWADRWRFFSKQGCEYTYKLIIHHMRSIMNSIRNYNHMQQTPTVLQLHQYGQLEYVLSIIYDRIWDEYVAFKLTNNFLFDHTSIGQ